MLRDVLRPLPVQIQSRPRESRTMRVTRLSASPSAEVKERIGNSRAATRVDAMARTIAIVNGSQHFMVSLRVNATGEARVSVLPYDFLLPIPN